MSAGKMLPFSQCETQKVQEVQFEIFKAKQIEEYAVCEVYDPRSYVNDKPLEGGISDLRMGSTDFEFTCQTCHMQHPDCPGHFGYIELAEPMFNIGLFDVTLQALRCVCKNCSALLTNPNGPQMQESRGMKGVNRLREVTRVCGNRGKCGIEEVVVDGANVTRGCGAEQIKVGRFTGIYPRLVIKATRGETEIRWSAADALQVLDRVSDEDARAMGFDPERCHPRDLIITKLPVPPPQVRPTVAFGTTRSDNELTHKLVSILKDNQRMRQAKETGAGREALDEIREVLQEHIATYFHNTSTYYKPAKINQKMPLKSISERLKGKYGRLRGNLMGKRVDFSGRTVITGDPVIDVDEVGVPMSTAMTLTFPERVNHINRRRLTEVVRRENYPSANYIIQPNGVMKKLSLLKNREHVNLNIGDIVERHVVNGDVVLFNRQPTLHRMSMMGHRVRVLPFNTFRLNLSCTTPYNADFDGDEMNLHVPQSLLSKAELIEMMMVPKNFVSPNKSAPCMGIVQDSLLGCYRLTDKEIFLDKHFVQSVAMWIDQWDLPIPAILKPEPLWTGKQIFSLILPDINFVQMDKNFFPVDDGPVMIRRGQLLTGAIKKTIVGAAPGSLIHLIFNEKGSDAVAQFINGVQRITQYFLYNWSFSVGVQDTIADKSTLANTNKILDKTRDEVKGIAAKANEGTLKRKSGMTLMQSFEKDVNGALNTCRESAAKHALGNVRRTNNFKTMIDAGSKGSHLNICQIAVMVGQQNVNGQRIPFGFRRRTLPHFMQDDYGEASRGMVNHGYVEGLKPYEFFFHTMGGREGLIDTAVKTADTGYLQRKLIKALEDIHAAYDGTVRNANGELVQLMYGEDGLDGARIEGSQAVNIIAMDDKKLRDTYRYEYDENGAFTDRIGGDYMSREVKRALRADRDNVRRLEDEYRQIQLDRDNARKWIEMDKPPIKISLPVNVERLIRNAQSAIGVRATVSDLNPVNVIDNVTKLQEELKQFFASYNKAPGKRFTNIYNQERVETALKLFSMHLRAMLSSKRVIKEYKLNDKAFEYLLSEVRVKYLQSMIQPGEMIGAIAAQSCGEPATQMTLNTFHNAGISSKNVTLGVPRLVELLNVSKTQKYSAMTIALTEEWSERSKCESAVHIVEYASLETITKRIQIFFDPNLTETIVEEDREFVAHEWDDRFLEADELEERERLRHEVSPFVVRLELDAGAFTDKKLHMKSVKHQIASVPEGEAFVVETSQDNAAARIIRLRLRRFDPKKADIVSELKTMIPRLLAKVHLCGIPGIKKVLTQETKEYPVNPETGALEEKKIWSLDTEGTALKVVMGGVVDAAGNTIVNHTKTSSNNIPEIYRELGIEAARRKLFLEMQASYVAYGVSINYRHYSILIDAMCQRGYLMAVSRVGINRSDAGPMMRSSFEETVKVLMGAAAFGECDPVRGVSANITLGNQAKVGTGLFDLILNMDTLQDAVPQEEAVKQRGRDANAYHGPSSIASVDSTASGVGRANRTPMVNDGSVDAAGSNLYTVPDSSAMQGLGSMMYTPMHGGTTESLRVGTGSVGGGFTADEFSAQYSAQSSAYAYEPVASSEFAADYAVPSDASFGVQSSEAVPYMAGQDLGLHNIPAAPSPYSSLAMPDSRSMASSSFLGGDSASAAMSGMQSGSGLGSRRPGIGSGVGSTPYSGLHSSVGGQSSASAPYVPMTPDYEVPQAPAAPQGGSAAANQNSASARQPQSSSRQYDSSTNYSPSQH